MKEGKGRVDVQEAVAIFLYIVGYNTQMRLVGDRFQHSTETVSRKFHRVLQALHTYDQHLIKPDSNVVGLLERIRSNNKYTILYASIIVEMKCVTHRRTLMLIEMMYKLGTMGILLSRVQVLKGGM